MYDLVKISVTLPSESLNHTTLRCQSHNESETVVRVTGYLICGG
ncbi:hypothetical protein VSP9026_02228 [Vibrio spartinae]|uniref:Uncharacterized protein n=1 Tax=Vibrio spartinae TaxID=1918945 RepID=A0A1N6M4Z0_9VIBR|nr:hypothetical protein VSP9026_02228 [Vibrio spartinae]